jgi:hypothetical protein
MASDRGRGPRKRERRPAGTEAANLRNNTGNSSQIFYTGATGQRKGRAPRPSSKQLRIAAVWLSPRKAEMIGAAVDPTDVLADLRFARDVAALHRLGPRAVYEFLVELGAARMIRLDLEQRARRWSRLDFRALQAASGARFPDLPIHAVPPASRDDA